MKETLEVNDGNLSNMFRHLLQNLLLCCSFRLSKAKGVHSSESTSDVQLHIPTGTVSILIESILKQNPFSDDVLSYFLISVAIFESTMWEAYL